MSESKECDGCHLVIEYEDDDDFLRKLTLAVVNDGTGMYLNYFCNACMTRWIAKGVVS